MRSITLVMVILWFFLLIPIDRSSDRCRSFGHDYFYCVWAAFFSEIVRAGIQSAPRGQTYAAEALSMTYGQNMRFVVLPQVFRNMIPVFMTKIIILFQNTSLVYAIGAYDLLKGFEIAGKNYGRPIETYILATFAYFIICFSLSKAVRKIQSKVAIIR